jgi:MFS family permease
VVFAGQLPTFLLAPFAGVWVDRLDRHRVLLVTQLAAMAQSATLAALCLTGRVTVGHLVVLGCVQGCINALDMPARQAFVVELLEDRADLPNAIALNSAMVNLSRLIGPSAAGLLIASFGEGWCFLLDSVSYSAVIGALLLMRLRPRPRRSQGGRWRQDLAEGLAYVTRHPPIRAVLLLLGTASLMGMPYAVLMPVIAKQRLGGGPQTLGFLMAAAGLGALAGTVYLASRRTVLGLGALLWRAAALFGLSLIALASAPTFGVAVLVLLVCGAAMMIHMAGSNTIVQTLVDDDKRGRTMSLYAMAFVGTAPFGSLLAGVLASRLGVPATLRIGGAVCVVAALLFRRALPRLRVHARPAYERLGLLPTADALEPPVSAHPLD